MHIASWLLGDADLSLPAAKRQCAYLSVCLLAPASKELCADLSPPAAKRQCAYISVCLLAPASKELCADLSAPAAKRQCAYRYLCVSLHQQARNYVQISLPQQP